MDASRRAPKFAFTDVLGLDDGPYRVMQRESSLSFFTAISLPSVVKFLQSWECRNVPRRAKVSVGQAFFGVG